MIREYTIIQEQVELDAQEVKTTRKERPSITSINEKEVDNKPARHTAEFKKRSINEGDEESIEDLGFVELRYPEYDCNTTIDESVNGDDLTDCDQEIIIDDVSDMDECE